MNYLLWPAKILTPFLCLLLMSGPAETAASQRVKAGPPGNYEANSGDSTRYKAAPDFTLETMKGKSFTLSDHEGQIVVLNIWATWCGPCREEIPSFIELQKEMREQGVLFAGLAVDEEGWDVIRPYARKMGINYPVIWDEGFDVTKKYGPLRGIPTTFIINRKGEVEYVAVGMIPKNRLSSILKQMTAR